MNRRQRREMSKKLGIMQYQRNLSREKKFELMRENIKVGKQTHEENLNKNRVTQSAQNENIESEIIYNTAKEIADRKQIPIIDALSEAQEEYSKQKK